LNDGSELSATCLWITFSATQRRVKALLDTGAGISLLPKQVYDSMTSQPALLKTDKKIEGANAAPIACFGKTDIKIQFGPFTCLQTFYVCEDDVTPLLGRDFMRSNDVYTRPAHDAVYKDGKPIATQDLASESTQRVACIRTSYFPLITELSLPSALCQQPSRQSRRSCVARQAHDETTNARHSTEQSSVVSDDRITFPTTSNRTFCDLIQPITHCYDTGSLKTEETVQTHYYALCAYNLRTFIGL
jgi:hypothetical protein